MTAFRPGGISYLRIPAPDPPALAQFYASVFGWTIDAERQNPSFRDGTGDVIGHFMRDLPVAGAAGVIPYVYVTDVDAVVRRATSQGAVVAANRYPEGNLWVAVLSDPAGNRVGVWQRADQE